MISMLILIIQMVHIDMAKAQDKKRQWPLSAWLHLASPLSGTCKICAGAIGAQCMVYQVYHAHITHFSTAVETKRPHGYIWYIYIHYWYNQHKSDLTSDFLYRFNQRFWMWDDKRVSGCGKQWHGHDSSAFLGSAIFKIRRILSQECVCVCLHSDVPG